MIVVASEASDLIFKIVVASEVSDLIFKIVVASEASDLIVASEASDLIFKIVIFHDVPCCTLVVLNLHREEVGVQISWGAPNSSETASYFLKPIMQDGSWLCQTCLVPFISQYLYSMTIF